MSKRLISIVNVANALSLFRVFLIPFIVYFLFNTEFLFFKKTSHAVFVSFLLYSIGSATDYFDGYFARKYGLQSKFGRFIDPLADKFLQITVMVSFLFIKSVKLIPLFVYVIVFRELLVTFMRVYAIWKNKEMKTESHGKLKTVLQIVSLCVVFSIVTFNAFVFDLEQFQSFIDAKHMQAKGFVDVDFSLFSDFFIAEFHCPSWLIETLKWTPNALFAVSFYYTLKSGFIYVYKNRKLFS